MKRLVVVLALLLVGTLGGCTSNHDDLTDIVTRGPWRVSNFIETGDEHTSLFHGYVFTFKTDGTVSVTRPGLPVAPGTWDEHNNNTRFDLDFGAAGLLEKLNEDWVVGDVTDDQLNLHEIAAPFNQVEFSRIY